MGSNDPANVIRFARSDLTLGQARTDIAEARRRYAEELRYCANVKSDAVLRAFATVAREHFLGPGPWHILEYNANGYWRTEGDDPAHLYHNVLVAIDRARGLNNGQPGLWAYLLDRVKMSAGERVLHIGAGVGYYSAIMSAIVGSEGQVTAIEADPDLAARARTNLADCANIEVVTGDGCAYVPEAADVIIVNAGVTHPQPHWLEALPVGGRLLVPLTVDTGGCYLKVTHFDDGYAARFISYVQIFAAVSGRDPEAEMRLKEAFERSGYRNAAKLVNSLRRDSHEANETCWLHAPDFCLSQTVVSKEALLESVRFNDS